MVNWFSYVRGIYVPSKIYTTFVNSSTNKLARIVRIILQGLPVLTASGGLSCHNLISLSLSLSFSSRVHFSSIQHLYILYKYISIYSCVYSLFFFPSLSTGWSWGFSHYKKILCSETSNYKLSLNYISEEKKIYIHIYKISRAEEGLTLIIKSPFSKRHHWHCNDI